MMQRITIARFVLTVELGANSGSKDTAPNKVIDGQSLRPSGLPRMSRIVRPWTGIDERRALAKPRPQDAVAEIGHGFLARGDGKSPRHRANRAQPFASSEIRYSTFF